MTTLFKAALSVCGLSQRQAAEFLNVSIDSIKAWSRGKTNPPIGALRDLAGLYQKIVLTSEDALDTLDIEGGKIVRVPSLDEIQLFAREQDGENLPEPCAMIAIAMVLLARLGGGDGAFDRAR